MGNRRRVPFTIRLLVGISNGTQNDCLQLKTGGFHLTTAGPRSTPTLAIVVDREKENP